MPRVLIACEFSGVVRNAFLSRGYDAYSCDMLDTESSPEERHLKGDVRDVLKYDWDLLIAHPPCTHLSVSGARWFKGKQIEQEEALDFIRLLLDASIPCIALENPVGIISTRIRKPDQIIQPYQFGHDASKRTCLWLKDLPYLRHTAYVEPRMVDGRPRWANQTDSGQNRLGPSPDRWALRSITYPGIADAMATQWGAYIETQM